MSKAEMYAEFLKSEGYSPTIDSDGDVVFKYEGRTYLLYGNESDPQFFRIAFPNFWAIESAEERRRVERACLEVTANMKVVKVYPVDDDTWASVELLVDPPEAFRAVFRRSLVLLQEAAHEFRERVTRPDGMLQ